MGFSMKIIFKKLKLLLLCTSILLTALKTSLVFAATEQVLKPESVTSNQVDVLKNKLFSAISTNNVEQVEAILSKMIKAGCLNENLCDLILLEAITKASTYSKSDGLSIISAFSKSLVVIGSGGLGLLLIGADNDRDFGISLALLTIAGCFLVDYFKELFLIRDNRLKSEGSKKILDAIKLKLKQKKAFEAKKSK